MLLGISDKAADISDKSIVQGVSINRDYVVKTLILDLSETQEGYMPACVLSFVVAEEWFLSGRRRRVILSVVPPIEQIGDRPMLAIVVERPLVITKESWFVRTEITARYHR